MSENKSFYSLAHLTVIEKDGARQNHWQIYNPARAGQPKGPASDPRAGMTIVADYEGPVVLPPGDYQINARLNDDGTYKLWGVVPTELRCTVDFVGLLPNREGDLVTEGAYGRYVKAGWKIVDGTFKGIEFNGFLNVEHNDLSKTNRGLVTRSFVRKALGLPASADLLAAVSALHIPEVPGSEWGKLHELGLANVKGMKAKIDDRARLVELNNDEEAAAKAAKLRAELAALEV